MVTVQAFVRSREFYGRRSFFLLWFSFVVSTFTGWWRKDCFVLMFVWSLHLLFWKMINILSQPFLRGNKAYRKDPAISFQKIRLFKHSVPELSVCLIWCLPQPAPPPLGISCWCKVFSKDIIKAVCVHVNPPVLLSASLAFMLCKCKRIAVWGKLLQSRSWFNEKRKDWKGFAGAWRDGNVKQPIHVISFPAVLPILPPFLSKLEYRGLKPNTPSV